MFLGGWVSLWILEVHERESR